MVNMAYRFVKDLMALCGKHFDASTCRKAILNLEDVFKTKRKLDKFGYRQLNEILLLCNERIISEGFFEFLADGESVISFDDFSTKVHKFRKLAMLRYGSFRFAFNYLSDKKDLEREFGRCVISPDYFMAEYRGRQKPIREIIQIPEDKLHLLGYLSSSGASEAEKKKIKEQGERNFETYLTYDYLDVYVATSMREKWEYVEVNRLCKSVFKSKILKNINIRYFDPTQNYSKNSISKGLIEGLMLKRAKCTLYMVQETDTMGKDSEMATTLAQGKPVIAYVPAITVSIRVQELKSLHLGLLLAKGKLLKDLVIIGDMEFFQRYLDLFAEIGEKRENKQWELLQNMQKDYDRFIRLIAKYEKIFYDKRAKILIHNHPLRFQIELNSGVANGVLVARTPQKCAKMIYKVLTNSLEFDIVEPGEKSSTSDLEVDELNYRLIEKETKCAFRVVTKDEMLTNSFWNLYKLGDIENGKI